MLLRYLALILLLGSLSFAQESGPTTVTPTIPKKKDRSTPARTGPAPKSAPVDNGDPDADIPEVNESSSKSTKVPMDKPTGDADATVTSDTPKWDPHRAAKDIEVGDYYFSEKNYRGAELRYRDALEWKAGDAVA